MSLLCLVARDISFSCYIFRLLLPVVKTEAKKARRQCISYSRPTSSLSNTLLRYLLQSSLIVDTRKENPSQVLELFLLVQFVCSDRRTEETDCIRDPKKGKKKKGICIFCFDSEMRSVDFYSFKKKRQIHPSSPSIGRITYIAYIYPSRSFHHLPTTPAQCKQDRKQWREEEIDRE